MLYLSVLTTLNFFFHLFRPGPVVQSVARLTEESEAPDSIPGPVYI